MAGTNKSLLTKAREKAEEIAEKVEEKYHEIREKPAREAAEATYKERMLENAQKVRSKQISEKLGRERAKRYTEALQEEKKPVERRAAEGLKDIGENLVRGAVGETKYQRAKRTGDTETAKKIESGDIKNTFVGGGVVGKFQADYRPSPQPRFRGKAPSGKSGGIQFGKTLFGQKPTKGIDFGAGLDTRRLGDLGRGTTIDFSRSPFFGGKRSKK